MPIRRISMALFSVIAVFAATAAADPVQSNQARFDTYAPDGESYFALSLQPAAEHEQRGGRHITVLLDTSASQTGVYREKALAALRAMLADLNDEDRVHLMAVDLRAISMSDGFVAPRGDEMTAALEKLHKRVPLGSTDLATGLKTAAESFPAEAARRSLAYIGDGMSVANLLDTDEFQSVVDQLVAGRVAVSSYSIGPRQDSAMLAYLANQTGGNLAVAASAVLADEQVSQQRAAQENHRKATEAGRFLAESVRGTVLWPLKVEWPEAFAEVYPIRVPPLRTDRASVVVGTGNPRGEVDVRVTVAAGDGVVDLQWKARPGRSSQDNAYLADLITAARRDGGMSLPTIGTRGLAELQRLHREGIGDLVQLAQHAAATGNAEGAQVFAREALRRDPGNPVASAVETTAGRGARIAPGTKVELRLVKQADDVGQPDEVEPPGAFLEEVEQMRRVMAEKIRADVEDELRRSRARMSEDPESVIQSLKLIQGQVQQSPHLEAETRAELLDQIGSALREASRQEAIKAEQELQQQQVEAAVAERRRLIDQLQQRQLRVKQLMDRLTSLMAEGRYAEAESDIVPELRSVDPDGVAPTVASNVARFAEAVRDNKEVDLLGDKGFVRTMFQIERSLIPFPDDPPIVYPDRDVWQDLTRRRRDRFDSVDLKRRSKVEEQIEEELGRPTEFEFIETPLEDVVTYLKDNHNIEIQLDRRALDDAGINPQEDPITRNLSGISLRSALRLLLRDLGLTYMIRDEVLLITTPDEVENDLVTKVYPVADLVLPIPQNGFSGGFGGLGGGIGGGGGGGLGGGGGGLGGGGGGFGGGGLGGGGLGGGGGGGFFNVADEAESQPQDKQQVEEETLKLFRAPAAEKKTPVSRQPAAEQADENEAKEPTVGSVEIDESVAPEVFWNDYFAANRPDPKLVRKLVRRLLRKEHLDHVIALCRAALRNGQPQPWMYEAMGLAMEAAGYPQEEIERALMSAADFSPSSESLQYIARYLVRLGLDRRALQLYRQVVTLEPLRHEAYAEAMQIAADRLDDLEGIKWTTVGVLGQAWPTDQLEFRQRAFRIAQATLDRLQDEGRHQEHAAYEQQLNESLVRDCVVKVSWTGDADVDLLVEEPGGSICSRRTPRTSGGGVMLGDSFAGRKKDKNQYAEYYVCPRGFAGNYRVLLRRVWGEITAGRVTLDIYTNYRTREVKHERQQIPLGDTDAVVKFELKQARRQEPLAAQQLAAAADKQLAVGRAVLAQHLNALSDPSLELEIARRRGLIDTPVNPRLRGAVGFQPVIITLPEGTNFAVTGVISADRRFVRITALPLFSGIGTVTTFTFAGGAQNLDNNGAGAGGGGAGNGGVGGGAPGNVGGGGGVPVGGGANPGF